MSMSKQDFVALADVIRAHNDSPESCKPGYGDTGFDMVQIGILADFLAAQNPRFNRSRWLAYIAGTCGPNGGAISRERRALRAFQGGAK